MSEVTTDKSLFYYGRVYHFLIDAITRQHREQVIARIPAGGQVLDLGCGTGELALALRAQKDCTVVGIDLSQRMIAYASSRNSFSEVTFLHRDATHIPDFEAGHFGHGVLCLIIHELPQKIQIKALREAVRLCREVLLLDYQVPLPSNGPGRVSRLIEATLGRNHYTNFKAYLEAGGLENLFMEAGISARIRERTTFNQGCHQVILAG